MISLLKKEKVLLVTGLLGLLLGLFCQIYIMIFGATTGAEGNLSKAVSFNVSLGIFLITTALIIGFAQLSRRMLITFRWAYVVAALYSYGLETIQHLRGIDPRFTQIGSPIDSILAMIFGLVAFTMIGFYIVFASHFFKKNKLTEGRRGIIIAIRYGMLTTMLSFAAGIWISVLQSRFTGDTGNIIWLHGFGFHGLQFIPIIAWLLEQQQKIHGRRLIHICGIVWTIAIISIAIQTLLGQSIFELSFIIGVAIFSFVVYVCIFIFLLITVVKEKRHPPTITHEM